jgi:hypothetical protein
MSARCLITKIAKTSMKCSAKDVRASKNIVSFLSKKRKRKKKCTRIFTAI